jgi:single-strand DNA-binding protein
MANLNKVMLIGRLTRDPEVRSFSNGGKVAKFGFAVNNRKKNQQTGQWEDDPVFLDVEAFNRGENGKQADQVEQYLNKGRQVFIEGHLRMDNWTDKDGQKRSKLVVVVENFQFLDSKPEGMGGEGGMTRAPRAAAPAAGRAPAAPANANGGTYYQGEPDTMDSSPASGGAGNDDDIPF